jgi:hypothetical protein
MKQEDTNKKNRNLYNAMILFINHQRKRKRGRKRDRRNVMDMWLDRQKRETRIRAKNNVRKGKTKKGSDEKSLRKRVRF